MKRESSLHGAYEDACNAYADELVRMWDISPNGWYWIADRVGELWDNGDITLNMWDVIYIVDNGIGYGEVSDWQEYCVSVHGLGLPSINLEAWHKGAPRLSGEELKRLSCEKNKE